MGSTWDSHDMPATRLHWLQLVAVLWHHCTVSFMPHDCLTHVILKEISDMSFHLQLF